MGKAKTLGELRASGYEVLPVKAEMRRNLIAKLRQGEALFPGIIGYDETVIPQIVNAILGGQDVMLLGERGEAKSRLVWGPTTLLDEEAPVVKGAEIAENPFRPIMVKGAPWWRRRATRRPLCGCPERNATARSWRQCDAMSTLPMVRAP